MATRTNTYRLTIEQVSLVKETDALKEPITFEFSNHDEIFNIVDIMRTKNPFGSKDQATEFAIGLKMFSEIMLQNRSNPLFDEFLPAMKIFMTKLKSS